MKILLLFDSDKQMDNQYREYELCEDLSNALKNGKSISLTFCHPDAGVGEQFIAKIEKAS